jgi:hypothetical protein
MFATKRPPFWHTNGRRTSHIKRFSPGHKAPRVLPRFQAPVCPIFFYDISDPLKFFMDNGNSRNRVGTASRKPIK